VRWGYIIAMIVVEKWKCELLMGIYLEGTVQYGIGVI